MSWMWGSVKGVYIKIRDGLEMDLQMEYERG